MRRRWSVRRHFRVLWHSYERQGLIYLPATRRDERLLYRKPSLHGRSVKYGDGRTRRSSESVGQRAEKPKRSARCGQRGSPRKRFQQLARTYSAPYDGQDILNTISMPQDFRPSADSRDAHKVKWQGHENDALSFFCDIFMLICLQSSAFLAKTYQTSCRTPPWNNHSQR